MIKKLSAWGLVFTALLLVACGGDKKANPWACKEECASDEVCVLGECQFDTGQTLEPPEDPACYTPCRGGTGCDDEGLLEGCIAGLECVEGTCVPPTDKQQADAGAGPRGTCTNDSECPEFQTCIQGRCYSDCQRDRDCRGDRVCLRKRCVQPCTAADDRGDGCLEGYVCELVDGKSGYCRSLTEPSDNIDPPQGSVVVEPTALRFTNVKTEAAFEITNDSNHPATFKIRKAGHRAFGPVGSETVEEDAMSWVRMSAEGVRATQESEISVSVPKGETVQINVFNVVNEDFDRWDGDLVVSNPALGDVDVSVKYKSGKAGRWTGHMYFMAANFGTEGLDEWLADKLNPNATAVLGNAFIQRWTAFRDGDISDVEFNAMLAGTEQGSWQWASVKSRCPVPGKPDPKVGCYMSLGADGVSVYSDSLEDFPIPSGVTKLPIAVNIQPDPDDGPDVWSGKIVSSESMHLPGDPAIRFEFADDPILCDGEPRCRTLLNDFGATVTVGGRYTTTRTGSCAAGFKKFQIPSLTTGFTRGTGVDSSIRYKYECRSSLFPYGNDKELADLSANAAGSNPIGDGALRRRQLELIDGAMISSDRIFLIFKETMPSFIDPTSNDVQTGYGYIILEPGTANLEDDAYAGNAQDDTQAAPNVAAPGCATSVLNKIATSKGVASITLNASSAAEVGLAVIRGVAPDLGSALDPGDVHYYCGTTDEFDSSGCEASQRTYFISATQSPLPVLADEPCMNGNGSCLTTFNGWLDAGSIVEPVFTCPLAEPICVPTTFYRPGSGPPAFPPIDEAINDAFAYKTEFTSKRSGGTLGFAPTPCDGSDAYCYDTAAIEEIEDRVDCATHIYTEYYDDIASSPTHDVLKEYLNVNYGWQEDGTSPGFERLFAQLLILLGDDAFARTFSTRFDLSGELTNASFQGSKFEPGGSDFSGPAGFEMNSLYSAAQYYQKVVDRFFDHAQAFDISLNELPAGQGFVTQSTASAYVERLLLASSQKSRAWTEVAKRYQGFNDADLASLILGRAYAGAYLESIVLGDILDQLSKGAPRAQRAQLLTQLEQAQRVYSVSFLDMNTANRQITDEVTVFGFAPDYVPFPVTSDATSSRGRGNAFEVALERAQEKMEDAKEKEMSAIEDATNFAGSEAEFFQELSNLQIDYETQLSDICGTFEAGGVVYPAIPLYQNLTPRTRALGDPCGFVGNGAIHDAILELQQAKLDIRAVAQERTNLLADIADEQARVAKQCKNITDLKNLKVAKEGAKAGLKAGIAAMNIAIDSAELALDTMGNLLELTKCDPPTAGTAVSPGNCVQSAVSAGTYIGASIGVGIGVGVLKLGIAGAEGAIDALDIDILKAELDAECDALEIDSAYEVLAMNRRALELEIEATKVHLGVQQALAQIVKLRNDASATMAAWEQAKGTAIDVAAAWADPNVRIYKNEAIINAERTFNSAVTEAYKATKVFEYFTSQSYAPLEKLYLVRMVQYGNPGLEQYLSELDDAFQDFQQIYGAPEERVLVVSLVDDIIRLSELATDNGALSQGQRTRQLRDLLAGNEYRDGNGRLVFPFSTLLENVSPQTLNHKISSVEAEIVPQIGDNQARVYLVQRGTGAVRNTEGTVNFYSLPQRQAVIETFFDGQKPLGDNVYQNATLTDRPLINTGWELVIDPMAETVNRDLDLGALQDIRLYFYYSDFTIQ